MRYTYNQIQTAKTIAYLASVIPNAHTIMGCKYKKDFHKLVSQKTGLIPASVRCLIDEFRSLNFGRCHVDDILRLHRLRSDENMKVHMAALIKL